MCKRRERTDPLDLPQQRGLRVVLFRDRHQPPVVVSDALGEHFGVKVPLVPEFVSKGKSRRAIESGDFAPN
jgi:hypothetical protein